jgi:negative regulator of flagellin synthesis FlgM
MDGINSLQKMLGALQVNDSTNVAAASAAGSTKAGTSVSGSPVGLCGKADSASLSAAGGLVSQAADTSDVRMTKVAELRQAIAGGTYSVPASAVADKMVENLLR